MKPVRSLAGIALFLGAVAVQAGDVKPSNGPLYSKMSGNVKPNIMFILDDSGSMGWEYMPDSVNNNRGSNCYRNSHYNHVYYDPSVTYDPPVTVDATGASSSYPDASWPNAWNNGFNAGAGTRNLSNNFRAGNDSTGQAAYYYIYSGSDSPVREDNCYADGNYTRVTVGAAEQQNFANWYSYYRTRIMMMKTALTQAFKGVDARFRVGYMSINNNTGSDFLNVTDFDATGKFAWYGKVTSAGANNGTGTRWALSTAGRLFAGKLNGLNFWGTTVTDPIQYTCQQNMAILSTDGFWNSQMTGMGCTSDQGCDVSGNAIGNTDSGLARPFRDVNGASGSLADIAAYYYNTDLRPSMTNNVFPIHYSDDPTSWEYLDQNDNNAFQHMNTHTIGLGVSGTLKYDKNYIDKTLCPVGSTTCDYGNLRVGPPTGTDWPAPTHDDPTAIDDLWHAAVNGHGKYFGAKSPAQVRQGLEEIIAGLARSGAGGAAATGSLVSSMADGIYIGGYKSIEWTGDLKKYAITSSSPFTIAFAWSAQQALDSQASRKIYMAAEDGGGLKDFIAANLTGSIAHGWFDMGPTNPNDTSIMPYQGTGQYSFFTAAQKSAATPTAVINFLRGDRTLEDANNTLEEQSPTKVFRGRTHLLGDIVNSSPIYVGTELMFSYQEAGYQDTFKATIKSRTPTIYVGANDGMLHAFNAADGTERWAFIPTAVMPYLFLLADKNYHSEAYHRYFVDGPITVGDVDFGGGDWHTVLVGGLGKGGKAFYALDITGDQPTLLWEYAATTRADNACVPWVSGTRSASTCLKDLGYTFGNAPMTRMNINGDNSDSTWAALFASGYDNDNISANKGTGWLFVVNAATGAKIAAIGTQASDPASSDDPSVTGISWVNGWNDNGMISNHSRHIYAGDLGGRVWRFNLKTQTVNLMTTLGFKPGHGDSHVTTVQPVTTRIELGEHRNDVNQRVLYVGTGRFLTNQPPAPAINDTNNTNIQSIYAIRDTDNSTSYPIGGTTYFRDTDAAYLMTSTGQNRDSATLTYNSAADSNRYGWYWDFNAASNGKTGERVIVSPRLYTDQNTLTVVTNMPLTSDCDVGGSGWVYQLQTQPATGATVNTAEILYSVTGAMVVGDTSIMTPAGQRQDILVKSDGTVAVNPGATASYGNSVRRVQWRELRD